MLAAARIGAIHSIVFGGFAAPELAKRITHAEVQLIVSCTGSIEPKGPVSYLPNVKEALDIVGKPDMPVIVKQRPELAEVLKPLSNFKGYQCLDELMDKYSSVVVDCIPVDAQ